MTAGKAIALALGFVGAVALGVWIGPHLTDRPDMTTTAERSVATAPEATTPAPSGSVATTRRAAPVEPSAPRVAVMSPELHKRLKPVLTEGTNLRIAADGFRDAEQFATVAHAARNTGVNFMLLKNRVLDQRKSLASAIREFNTDVNAAMEVSRARAMARADIAALSL